MKYKKIGKIQIVKAAKGCKWSNLKAQGTGNHLSHPVLKLEEFHFPLLALWGNKNWCARMKIKKLEKIKIERCKGLQMVQFEGPRQSEAFTLFIFLI